MTTTLGELAGKHGFAVLEHLEAEAQVPVLSGLQAQGDLFIVPNTRQVIAHENNRPVLAAEVPAAGIAVIEAVGSGHEHRLFAGQPGTAWWYPGGETAQDIGILSCTEPAYLLHPEHGATGVAPGRYLLRRQREQGDTQHLVAD